MQEHDGRGETNGVEAEPEGRDQQGGQGQVQVLAEVLPQRSLLPRQGGECKKNLIWQSFFLFGTKVENFRS